MCVPFFFYSIWTLTDSQSLRADVFKPVRVGLLKYFLGCQHQNSVSERIHFKWKTGCKQIIFLTNHSLILCVCSLWSTGCTAPTIPCKQRPTAPFTVWSIKFTLRWLICGTRGRWRPIRPRPEATWVWRRWWSRACASPLEMTRWEQNTPHCWSSRRWRRRSR